MGLWEADCGKKHTAGEKTQPAKTPPGTSARSQCLWAKGAIFGPFGSLEKESLICVLKAEYLEGTPLTEVQALNFPIQITQFRVNLCL